MYKNTCLEHVVVDTGFGNVVISGWCSSLTRLSILNAHLSHPRVFCYHTRQYHTHSPATQQHCDYARGTTPPSTLTSLPPPLTRPSTQIGEIARTVHYIRKHLVNHTIKACQAYEDDIVYGKVGCSAKAFAAAVEGRKVTGADQQGKVSPEDRMDEAEREDRRRRGREIWWLTVGSTST